MQMANGKSWATCQAAGAVVPEEQIAAFLPDPCTLIVVAPAACVGKSVVVLVEVWHPVREERLSTLPILVDLHPDKVVYRTPNQVECCKWLHPGFRGRPRILDAWV